VFQLCTVKKIILKMKESLNLVVLMHLMHQGPHFDNDSEDNDSVILKKEAKNHRSMSSQCSLDYTETFHQKEKKKTETYTLVTMHR